MNASTQTVRELTPDQPQHPQTEGTTATPGAEHAAITGETAESVSRASETAQEAPRARKPRGFAAMDRSLVSTIARKGGKAAHEAGTAHEFSREEARDAGRKGGQATHAKRRAKSEPPASQ